MRSGSDILYYFNDHLGSVVSVLDGAGSIQNTYLYTGWGSSKRQVLVAGDRKVY